MTKAQPQVSGTGAPVMSKVSFTINGKLSDLAGETARVRVAGSSLSMKPAPCRSTCAAMTVGASVGRRLAQAGSVSRAGSPVDCRARYWASRAEVIRPVEIDDVALDLRTR